MSAAAFILLGVVAVICVAGVFAHAYRDNWLQFTGLTLLSLWSAGELLALARGYQPQPREIVLYLALAAFLAGTAWKVVQHRPSRCGVDAHSTQPGEAS